MKSILLAAAFLGSLCWAGTNPYNIIPEPVNVTTTSGTTKNLKIIHEQKVAGLGNEGYAMKLTPGGVELRYTTPNGKAMAMATLFQLQDQLSDTPEGLPCGSIQDSPDFGWRGMMVDVGRYHYPMLLLNKDRQVRILEKEKESIGIARGITPAGELLVEDENGAVRQVLSGEVSVRGLYSYV